MTNIYELTIDLRNVKGVKYEDKIAKAFGQLIHEMRNYSPSTQIVYRADPKAFYKNKGIVHIIISYDRKEITTDEIDSFVHSLLPIAKVC